MANEVLVTTEWVEQNLGNPAVRLVEVSVNTKSYDDGHIRGAVAWDWQNDIRDTVQRDIPDRLAFQELLRTAGITAETIVVLYGDFDNWFAAYAFWLLKVYRFTDVRLLNGGRKLWLAEEREITTEVPVYLPSDYVAPEPDYDVRAFLPQVQDHLINPQGVLVDVRTSEEYWGEVAAPPGLMHEGAQRAGHIPGAIHIAWAEAVHPDGVFKSPAELAAVYEAQGITADKDIITYCRIGERAAHTWFVLRYLLGYERVRNYDGSWIEWGNMIGLPVERS